jgi:hypothetical protein
LIATYTAIVGDYPFARTDIPCLGGDRIFTYPVLDAKRYKALPHLYFPDADVTIWVDGNIWLNCPQEQIVKEFLGDADIGLFAHFRRATVWQEFAILREDPRFAIPFLQKQLVEQEASYRTRGLPEDTRVYECNFLVRRNTEPVNRLMDAWWAEICRWQWRDQVSFPYVLWKYGAGINVKTVERSNIRRHHRFTYRRHY